MQNLVQVGMGKNARLSYRLNQIGIVPNRRTRGSADISLDWQIDAHRCALPLVTAPTDAVISPQSAIELSKHGALAVLNGEGLWARYEDPSKYLAEISKLARQNQGSNDRQVIARLQQLYQEPVKPQLLADRVAELNQAQIVTAVRLSPQNTEAYAMSLVAAGVDILVIHGAIVTAEHVAVRHEALNLKTFIADLDIPVIVGGCSDYQTALHLMRTGAAGVIVGHGQAATAQTSGITIGMATVIADAAAARRDYLDETGGRYVHIIAHGELGGSGDIARAIACGADAVMLGQPLTRSSSSPAQGVYWDVTASHPRLPRGQIEIADQEYSLTELLTGPTSQSYGQANLFGALRSTMAKTGYSTVKGFQKVDIAVC